MYLQFANKKEKYTQTGKSVYTIEGYICTLDGLPLYIFFQSTQFWCLLIMILWNDHFRRFRLCIYFLFPAAKIVPSVFRLVKVTLQLRN